MSKKKKIILCISILAIIIISFIIGNVYARYRSRVRGDALAEIATWSFKVNGQSEQVQTINLQSTFDDETLINNKIAPGTSGRFNLLIDATGSEVGLTYDTTIIENSRKPTNLKFSVNGVTYNSMEDLANHLVGTINANDENKLITIPIEWFWAYQTEDGYGDIEQHDIEDTNEGQTLLDYKFDIIISGTQVTPM